MAAVAVLSDEIFFSVSKGIGRGGRGVFIGA
jgi:hypothetical protein